MNKTNEEKYLFEEFNSKGQRVLWTTDESSSVSKEDMKHRAKECGYKYKLNGKFIKL